VALTMTDEYPYANAVVVISAVPAEDHRPERGPPGGSPEIGGGSSA
jgi:hypothetical protein